MKSEPDTFSIADLEKRKKSLWDGVRNFQARNFMSKEMSIGDEVIFYHSSADPSGAAGTAKVSRAAVADPTQFDAKSEGFEPRASREKPMWFCVEVAFQSRFARVVSLAEMRADKALQKMLLLKPGQRLSILPLTEKEFVRICELAKK